MRAPPGRGHTIEPMLGWSLPFGKVSGVELRLHSFFLFLLLPSLAWASLLDVPSIRGFVLWVLLLLAVGVRETARGVMAAWLGIVPRQLLLLPTGGLPVYPNPEITARAGERSNELALALAGELGSLLFAALCAAFAVTAAPEIDLTSFGWVSPLHLVRAVVWVNVLLAVVNLLPAWPLDAGRLLHGEVGRRVSASRMADREQTPPARLKSMRTLAVMGLAIAGGLILAGALTTNLWLVMAGLAVLVGAQLERAGARVEAGTDPVRVRDVMLLEYSMLSASATLDDAAEQARHTLQDVFPVVRSGNMVGAVARGTVLEALDRTGNGYVQGVMTREFHTAQPEEPLVEALGRVTGVAGVSQLVVVLAGGDSEQVLGIITPQNLQRSMGLLARRPTPTPGRRGQDDTA